MGYSYDAGSYLEKMYETARYMHGFSPTTPLLIAYAHGRRPVAQLQLVSLCGYFFFLPPLSLALSVFGSGSGTSKGALKFR